MHDPLNQKPIGSDPNSSTPGDDSTDHSASKSSADSESDLEKELAEVEAALTYTPKEAEAALATPHVRTAAPPLVMVETAFLASTSSLLWLVSYYLSIGPWMRILFPIPIALVYIRWGKRAAWMSAIVAGLLLSVLMGPYLSLLFLIPYGLLGIQLGFMWHRGAPWLPSIFTGMLIATTSFFFRLWLLSVFLGEDLWAYLTNRITDFMQWGLGRLVDAGLLSLDVLGQTNLTAIQIVTVLLLMCSDVVYLFTVHLAAWLLLERLGNPIPEPPRWVQVMLEEE